MVLDRALLSVADKTGVAAFAKALVSRGVEILSTGGTARHLEEADIPVTQVESLVGFPHLLGGRVKTLAPQIHAGILADRSNPDHTAQLEREGIQPIDLVAVDLYPFEAAMDARADLAALVEEIDIGGITLLRAAAKNHAHVAVLSKPDHYDEVLAALEASGEVPIELRRRLAHEAFTQTQYYDSLISHGLAMRFRASGTPIPEYPDHYAVPLAKVQDLRYGENHHQSAAYYADRTPQDDDFIKLPEARQLHGKALSYNNILDANVTIGTVREFPDPTVVIVKHATPSGVACAPTLREAWDHAFATDTYSPFGGIVAVNRPLDVDAAQEMAKLFLEIVIAPSYAPDALALLKKKKNLRLLEIPTLERPYMEDRRNAESGPRHALRSVGGGVIVQELDLRPFDTTQWKTVTKRQPTDEELESMLFGVRVAKHVKSNAVAFTKGRRTVGIGGGQTARVDASWIACRKGGENIKGSCMASDAFFPFRDAVDVAAEHGVRAIVQPGGSIRDAEVFAAADEHDIAMVVTDHRLFAH